MSSRPDHTLLEAAVMKLDKRLGGLEDDATAEADAAMEVEHAASAPAAAAH